MQWFYAQAGQQIGPVDDAEFERLISTRVIEPATLVWREGMANWEPLSQVRPVAPSTPPMLAQAAELSVAPPGHVICSECRKALPVEETVQIGNANVCAACKPIYVQKLREGAVTFTAAPAEMRYAGFWIRFGAKLVDGMIMMIITLPFSFMFGFQIALNPMKMPDLSTIILQQSMLLFLGMTVRLLYTWLMVGRYGATFGKMAVGIKVVTADGQRVSYARAFARYWGEIVSQFTCNIGYLIAAWDEQKRTLHDHMCHTRVVYK